MGECLTKRSAFRNGLEFELATPTSQEARAMPGALDNGGFEVCMACST